jgi:hypothetical protein
MVGKLPRVTCPKCANPKKLGQCEEHRKAKCDACKAYVSERHIHIDYVGHADVTSRLLEADPGWNWEPKAEDEHGLPVFDTDDHGGPVGLWVKLTVGGVTRLGYGSVPSGQNDAVKVLIGDALRNAAMRFGVALDLWAKGDRADPAAENATASAGQAARRGSRRQSAGNAWDDAQPARPAQGAQRNGNGNGTVQRPAQPSQCPAQPAADDDLLGAWGAKVDEITSQEDADQADAELKEVFKAKKIDAAQANAIRRAIRDKAESLKASAA